MAAKHKNNIARVLIHAFLECVLIVCLLINGFCSYLLSKFAAVVGLAPPCMLCTRIDHLFQPPESKKSRCGNTRTDFLCARHVNQVIESEFCRSSFELEDRDDDDNLVEGRSYGDGWKSSKLDVVFPEGSLVVEQLELVSRTVADNVCMEGVGEFYDVERLVPLEMIDEVTVKNGNMCAGVIFREEKQVASIAADTFELPEIKQQSLAVGTGIFSKEEDVCIPTVNEEIRDAVMKFGEEWTEWEPEAMLTKGRTVARMEAVQDVWTQDAETDNKLCNEELKPKILLDIQPDKSVAATSQAEHDKLPQSFPTPEHTDVFQDLSENEEETLPETLRNFYGVPLFHSRFVESLDGSVASDGECSELMTVDQLKSALQAEHRALSALYAELEEERNASAIAADQAMAMITRLQEEKAAIQMEASQYQRMMEEQSEYDQELLHHLNELLVEREKEKQELEEELEVYRKKYLGYKAYKKRMNSSTEMSSDSSSDGDNFSLELVKRIEYAYSAVDSSLVSASPSKEDQATAKHLILLDDSLAELNEERHSVLENLRTLEERLMSMEDEDCFGGMKNSLYENGNLIKGTHEGLASEEDDDLNTISEFEDSNNKFYSERRDIFLPLFNPICHGIGEDASNKEEEQYYAIVDCWEYWLKIGNVLRSVKYCPKG